jgi:Ran GTPase-activating protein (RanGAP) involved in mRNA processing and transport
LDISNNYLYVEGAKLLAESLKGNKVMTELNLSSNLIATIPSVRDGEMSAVIALADAIKDMRALIKLDISSNYIAAAQGEDLQRICAAGSIELAK